MSLDELQQAAEWLRELVSRLESSGPWWVPARRAGGEHTVETWHPAPGEDWEPVAECGNRSDALYIATMHPGVGLALADWLESQATDASEVMLHAYDIAQLINGAAAPVSDKAQK